jgi:hypothetical protein
VRALVQRARRLAFADYATLIESMVLAMGIELALRLMPFARIWQWSGSDRSGGSRRGGSLDPPLSSSTSDDLYWRLARFTAVAFRVLPIHATCLRESLVLCALLNRRGARARLCLGVNVDGARFAAHAWVDCEGVAPDAARAMFGELRALRG